MTEIIHLDSHSTPQIVADITVETIRQLSSDVFELHNICPEIFVEEVYEGVVVRMPAYLTYPRSEDVVDVLIDNENLFEED